MLTEQPALAGCRLCQQRFIKLKFIKVRGELLGNHPLRVMNLQ
jgi:hypothetical protein